MKKIWKSLKMIIEMILGKYKNEDFINLIKKEFDFLIQEYDFSMEENIDYKYSYDGAGTITYYSNNFIIEIYKGRVDDLSIKIKPVSMYMYPKITLPFGSIIEYRTNREFTMKNFQKSLSGKTEERLPIKIVQYAELLRKHCEPLLRGDFSWWPNAVEYGRAETEKFYRSLGVKNPHQQE